MVNIIDNEFKKLEPYFMALSYAMEPGFVRISIKIPQQWNPEIIYAENVVLSNDIYDEKSSLLMIGMATINGFDKPVDYFLNKIKELIDFNLKEQKKKELIQKKMEELSQYFTSASLEELESFNPINKKIEIKEELIENTNTSLVVDNEVVNSKKNIKK